MSREVWTKVIEKKGQMLGTAEEPIQIDEAWFAWKRKYNRGRLSQGNCAPQSEDSDALLENNRNHGRRIDGPWIFGLKQGLDCRYFYVNHCDKETLVSIITRECAQGSVIHSDEWPAYSTLKSLGFIHSTVNDQENYVKPASGTNTQGIECSWLDVKIKILRKMRGTTELLLQSHLNEYCYRVMRKHSQNMLLDFLNDVKSVYWWICSVFIIHLAVFILIQKLVFPHTVPLNTWIKQVSCSEFIVRNSFPVLHNTSCYLRNL
jgi:hypothetical protein